MLGALKSCFGLVMPHQCGLINTQVSHESKSSNDKVLYLWEVVITNTERVCFRLALNTTSFFRLFLG